MSPPTALSRDTAKTGERRSRPRASLQCVVLVFFEGENWGKVIEMNEGGMSFEFAHFPPLRQPISFTFQVMGCMPMPRAGEIFGESFEAVGEILWTRPFERFAGARFLELEETSRERIRRWISFGKTSEDATPVPEAKPKLPPAIAEPPEPALASSSEMPAGIDVAEAIAKFKKEEFFREPASTEEPLFASESVPERQTPESLHETVPEPEQFAPLEALGHPRWWESRAEADPETDSPLNLAAAKARKSEEIHLAPSEPESPSFMQPPELPPFPEAAAREAAELRELLGRRVTSDHPFARAAFVGLAGCIAAIAVFAGGRMLVSHWGRSAEGVESAPAVVAASEHTGPVRSLAGEQSFPFQVEVLDTSGKRWVLWFTGSPSSNTGNAVSPRAAGTSHSAPSTEKTGPRKETPPTEKPQVARDFTLAAPKPGAPGNSSLITSTEAPALSAEFSASLAVPMASGPARPDALAPATPRVGGDVQQPLLIKSVPPEYPSIAKKTGVAGDVVMEAVIDPAGNVTAIKVISGNPMLRDAAVKALRQWKYEPARLDGSPVPLNLQVALRFRIK